MGFGCVKPSQPPAHEPDKSSSVENIFELAKKCSTNESCDLETLGTNLETLDELKLKELANKEDEGHNFAHLMVKAKIEKKSVDIMKKFFDKLEKQDSAILTKHLDHKKDNKSLLDVAFAAERPQSESISERDDFVVMLVHLRPIKTNEIADIANFNRILTKVDAQKLPDVASAITAPKIDSWILWAFNNKDRSQLAVKRIYQKAPQAKQGEIFTKLYSQASNDDYEFKILIGDMVDTDAWGVKAAFASNIKDIVAKIYQAGNFKEIYSRAKAPKQALRESLIDHVLDDYDKVSDLVKSWVKDATDKYGIKADMEVSLLTKIVQKQYENEQKGGDKDFKTLRQSFSSLKTQLLEALVDAALKAKILLWDKSDTWGIEDDEKNTAIEHLAHSLLQDKNPQDFNAMLGKLSIDANQQIAKDAATDKAKELGAEYVAMLINDDWSLGQDAPKALLTEQVATFLQNKDAAGFKELLDALNEQNKPIAIKAAMAKAKELGDEYVAMLINDDWSLGQDAPKALLTEQVATFLQNKDAAHFKALLEALNEQNEAISIALDKAIELGAEYVAILVAYKDDWGLNQDHEKYLLENAVKNYSENKNYQAFSDLFNNDELEDHKPKLRNHLRDEHRDNENLSLSDLIKNAKAWGLSEDDKKAVVSELVSVFFKEHKGSNFKELYLALESEEDKKILNEALEHEIENDKANNKEHTVALVIDADSWGFSSVNGLLDYAYDYISADLKNFKDFFNQFKDKAVNEENLQTILTKLMLKIEFIKDKLEKDKEYDWQKINVENLEDITSIEQALEIAQLNSLEGWIISDEQRLYLEIKIKEFLDQELSTDEDSESVEVPPGPVTSPNSDGSDDDDLLPDGGAEDDNEC